MLLKNQNDVHTLPSRRQRSKHERAVASTKSEQVCHHKATHSALSAPLHLDVQIPPNRKCPRRTFPRHDASSGASANAATQWEWDALSQGGARRSARTATAATAPTAP